MYRDIFIHMYIGITISSKWESVDAEDQGSGSEEEEFMLVTYLCLKSIPCLC